MLIYPYYSQKIGIIFENSVHNAINNHLRVTNLLREKDIKNIYGINNSGIDHMFDIFYTNISICIQDKWEETKSSISTINHFIKCVQNIQLITNKQIIGIFLSKLPITKNSLEAFNFDNRLLLNIKFINIHLDEKEYSLVNSKEILIDKLLDYLHLNYQLWTHDFDDSIIMR
jgi:hypothetical protein